MNKKEIYLAGGCFWGVEAYFRKIKGVLETSVGYANGKTDQTTYNDIDSTGHSETVKISYDQEQVSLTRIDFYQDFSHFIFLFIFIKFFCLVIPAIQCLLPNVFYEVSIPL